MFYLIYKTTLINSNKFYIGRHITKNITDNYFGSGKWVRSIKDRTLLQKEILGYSLNFDNLKLFEEQFLLQNINNPNCMNFNNKSCGFASGDLNPNKCPIRRKLLKNRALGNKNGSKRSLKSKLESSIRMKENNPTKSLEVREKISKKVSLARKGIKYSAEGRKKLSDARKLEYLNNTRLLPTNKGMKLPPHSEITKEKMRGKRDWFWITNGTISKPCKGDIPENWYKGRVFKKYSNEL